MSQQSHKLIMLEVSIVSERIGEFRAGLGDGIEADGVGLHYHNGLFKLYLCQDMAMSSLVAGL